MQFRVGRSPPASPYVHGSRFYRIPDAYVSFTPPTNMRGLVIRDFQQVDTLYLQMPRPQVEHYATPRWTGIRVIICFIHV